MIQQQTPPALNRPNSDQGIETIHYHSSRMSEALL